MNEVKWLAKKEGNFLILTNSITVRENYSVGENPSLVVDDTKGITFKDTEGKYY